MINDVIQEAIDAINKVLNIHENHLFDLEAVALDKAIKYLKRLKNQGFK